jgi:3-dehydroquinate synthase
LVTTREIALTNYRVLVSAGALERAGDVVAETAPAHRYAIITDANVGPVYAQRVRDSLRDSLRGAPAHVFTIPAGEAHKTRQRWALLTDEMLSSGFGRDSAVIALGGGVVGDLAGFVASTFMRGIPFVQIPTSLLAMIDASVGGKTGVDTPAGKNLVGAFHQPTAVIADTAVLKTLPIEHLRAGMAEALKHGVIADASYFERVASLATSIETLDLTSDAALDLVVRSVEIKADVVERDEREGGVRKTLNFGHTIGHAVESCSGYELLHGEAIAIGMRYEALLAERLGIAEAGLGERIGRAIELAGLPSKRPASIPVEEIVVATHSDKKARGGQVEYALPVRIGAMAESGGRWSVPVHDEVVSQLLR